MSTLSLLSELREQNIKIHLEGDALRLRVPGGNLDPDLHERLKQHKQELIDFLQGSAAKNYPLSRHQRRMWVLSRLLPNPPAFAVNWAARCTGIIDPKALEKAVKMIIERHETLRTTFKLYDYVPRQVIGPVAGSTVRLVDLTHLPESKRDVQVAQWMDKAGQQPFDLENGPLIRVALIRMSPQNFLLYISLHRLISDNWSAGLFLRELQAFYQHIHNKTEVALHSQPKQYGDYVRKQNEWLQTEDAGKHVTFWKKNLKGSLPVLEMPGDRPRPKVFTFTSLRQPLQINSDLAENLRELADQKGANLFTILLTAYKTLLTRFTGRRDVIVGTPVSDRNLADSHESIGCYTNWLVLRTNMGADKRSPGFRELLSRVNNTTLAAQAHRGLPLERLIKELQPERDLSRHPIFQMGFILGQARVPMPDLGVKMQVISKMGSTSELDVTLILGDSGDGLQGYIEYNKDIFQPSTMARLAARFHTLLEGIVSFPDATLDELPILTEVEKERVLLAWNETYEEFPMLCLHQLFESQVGRSPTAPAVEFEGKRLSFIDLNQRATELAYFLRSLGVGPDVAVTICIERSFEMIIGMLGILKSGGAYVPLDPELPEERQEQILQAARAPVVLTRSGLARHLPPHPGQTVFIDTEQDQFEKAVTDNPLYGGKPLNLAYINFTSGQSGEPKGVMTTHLGVVNRLLWMRETYALGRRDRVLQKTPFTYDISVWEFFLPLISGATAVMARPDGHRDPTYLVDLMSRRQVSLVHFTPSMLQACLDTNQMESCLALRRVLCSEEALPRSLQERFLKHCPDAELHNLYGPPEIAIDVSFWAGSSRSHWQSVPIGKPISNVQVYVLDLNLRPVPIGVEGELYVGGESLARGYLDDTHMTSEYLIPDPFSRRPGSRIYKTGDLVRYLPDGHLEFLGHIDHQQKVSGSRIEYGEVKAVLETVPGVRDALAMTREDIDGLVAYYIPAEDQEPDIEEMRNQVKKILPNYMCPDAFVRLDAFPITPNGRINRRALPQPKIEMGERESTYARAFSQVERSILRVWQEVLGLDRIGVRDDFFELGGNSLKLMKVYDRLPDILKSELTRIDLFKHRNIHDLAFYMEEEEDPDALFAQERDNRRNRKQLLTSIADRPGLKIAIVGMSLRFPGINDEETFWQVLQEGRTTVQTFSKEELTAGDVHPDEMNDPSYVPVRAVLDDVGGFDHSFFGITPREAQLTDPQQRIMLECAWEALENAGYDPTKFAEPIGLFAGSGHNHYLDEHLLPNKELMDTVGWFPVMICNTKDNMCPRISYKLGLSGPSVAIQTACSTSLVSVHMASQALRAGDCGLALAGGVSLGSLTKMGYVYEEGMLQPPDGHCRSFDAGASGSIPGQGAGFVVLRRLEDAIANGDRIYAVINGSGVNNDGAAKENYTTYSVEGQAKVIRHAMKVAGVKAEDISFVETSSTASKIGDPIELAALTKAFGEDTDKKGFCAVGAVKPNIGNLDTAAGIAALIKASLAIQHGELPGNINFETPNPKIDFANSPFTVPTRAKPWNVESGVRRAGVSAFGLGGTNAHLILEEGPELPKVTTSRPWQLITLSARTPAALDTKTRDLARYLARNPHVNFAEVAYTLHVGRKDFPYRRMLTCQNLHEAVLEFERKKSRRVYTKALKTKDRSIAFMFPGQGAQYLNMGRELYRKERLFRQEVEQCWDIIREHVPELFKNLTRQDRGGRTEKLNRTYVAQPALFITEYALAKLLMHWGIQPQVMFGNSLGEFVAACLSGVFSLLEALDAVVTRGRLMQSMPPGSQLMVSLQESQVQSLLHEQLSLAALIEPNSCVLSGSKEAISDVRRKLVDAKIDCRRLHTSHAFHSHMMDPILGEFTDRLKLFDLKPPKIPFISNLTGTWITDEQATDPHYWARQLREPVRFYQGMQEIYNTPNRIVLEVGPEKTLSPIAIGLRPEEGNHQVLATMPQPHEEESDMHFLLNTVGRLWLAGVPIDWNGFHDGHRRRRLALPTYPFERTRAWIDIEKKTDKKEESYWLQPDEIDDMIDDSALDAPHRPNVSTDFVAPRNRDEENIAEVWRDFLGMKELGIHDDFFELGGTSLIAVRLTGKLGKIFNVPMASHTLIQRRTIAMLSEYIAEHRATGSADLNDSPIVEIQRGNPRVMPLVMVHPVGGEVYFYKDLALNLGAMQPVYGIQAPSLVGNKDPFDNIPKQAAYYIEELLKFQPKPPYILGGSSYGGVVAYEMSQQLHARGIPVALTVLVDSPAPGAMPGKTPDFASILDYLLGDELAFDLTELRELEPEEQLNYVFEEARHVNRVDILPPSLGIPMFKTWMAHQDALWSYTPKAYPGRMIFFRPTEIAKLNVPNMHLPWIDLVKGGIEIHQVPGNHITMNYEPNVKIMAKHLKRALRGIR